MAFDLIRSLDAEEIRGAVAPTESVRVPGALLLHFPTVDSNHLSALFLTLLPYHAAGLLYSILHSHSVHTTPHLDRVQWPKGSSPSSADA